MLVVNVLIVIVSGLIFGGEIALFTIISMFATMKTYEIILSHVNRVSVLIITNSGEEFSHEINVNLHRLCLFLTQMSCSTMLSSNRDWYNYYSHYPSILKD
ncbi:YitT family protein [Psychrobacillus sp. L4]|uniref:YitT family protein n=1 Tax=Psychrobacillus sp. L4 TaxID=3236892 RepID=UPI0036F28FAC